MAAYQSQTSERSELLLNHIAHERPRAALPAMRALSVTELFQRVGLSSDLASVEALLLERTRSRSALLSAAGEHTVRAGGKRLRAALAILAARLGHGAFERVIHPAASAELIHAASLVHDDLVDQAARRRGRVTVHARWDNDVALMLGDYFFALAAGEMALSPDPRIITFYADAVQTIVAGELSPVTQIEPPETALAQYLYKTGCKTAALFEAACKAGMTAGGGSDEQIAALGRYGFDLGIAFQIVDDVLDFVGDEQTLGKPAGNDLRQGTITMPLIYAVAAGGSHALRTVIDREGATPAEIGAVVAEVIALGATERTMNEARRYIAQAIGYLEAFPPSPARQALIELAFFVTEREA